MSSGLATERTCIFISYRRDDSRGASGRVWDWLRIGFGRERVFRDVASIGAGKWRQNIEQALAASSACVAVIGRRWADATNLPRLQDPNDMVRHELETALASGDQALLTVIPLLVEDAQLAQIPADQLPESLQPLLVDWNVLALSESGWDDDTRRLIEAIAAATGLPVNSELEEWMALMAGAQQGLSMARVTEAAGAPGRHGEELALESLLHRAAGSEPEERHDLKAALAALAAGDTLLAEESFEQQVEASRRLRLAAEHLAASEGRREADAARNVASLAVVRGDLSKAVHFFKIALEANPKDLDTGLMLGYAWVRRGDLTQAKGAFELSVKHAVVLGDRWREGRGINGLGDVQVLRGDLEGALALYRAGLEIAMSITMLDPDNRNGVSALAISHERVGNVLSAQADREGAFAAYKESLRIRVCLAIHNRENAEQQRDLSVIQEKIGDLLMTQGDVNSAISAYEESLGIREGLAIRGTATIQLERDLLVSYERLGKCLESQGAVAGALMKYQAAMAIAEELSQRDPANSEWKRDLAVCHERIGDLLLSQDDPAGALIEHKTAMNISEELTRSDPSNTEWQHDLSLSHERIGDIIVLQDDTKAALSAFREGFAIRERLARHDPANTHWQRSRYIAQGKVADMLLRQGEISNALDVYQQVLASAEDLAVKDPENTQWQVDLAVTCGKLGSMRPLLPIGCRKAYLLRGHRIMLNIGGLGKLFPSLDRTKWFDQALKSLEAETE